MTWHQTGNKSLPEPKMTQFMNLCMHHKASMSWMNCSIFLRVERHPMSYSCFLMWLYICSELSSLSYVNSGRLQINAVRFIFGLFFLTKQSPHTHIYICICIYLWRLLHYIYTFVFMCWSWHGVFLQLWIIHSISEISPFILVERRRLCFHRCTFVCCLAVC